MKTILLCLLICLPVSGAVVFDGQNDIIGMGTAGDTVFNEGNPVTISLFFSAVDDGEANAGTFIRRGNNILRIAPTYAIQFTSGSVVRKSINSVFATNFPNHLVLTWDGSGTAANIHIYLNTAEVSYSTTTDGTIATDNSADTLTIGSNFLTTTSFSGTIFEVAVWGSVLTTSEIQSLFRSRVHYFPLQVSPSNILAYWPLDDFGNSVVLSGTDTVFDRSSKNRHGTATNGPIASASTIISYP